VVAAAARAGLLDARGDLLAAVVAVEAVAQEQAAAAIALALHLGVVRGASPVDDAGEARLDLPSLVLGTTVGALALSSDDLPTEAGGRLSGRASWVAPLVPEGIVLVGARRRAEASPDAVVCAASLSGPGVIVEPMETAGLLGIVCGHVRFADTPCVVLGDTSPVMASIRILLAAAGIGMGQRALRESLTAARGQGRTIDAGGEQTIQGLLADTATELDAAMLLTWKAATASLLSLAEASMAKLAATDATQRAVARATQIVGADAFRLGHVIGRLAQDVRALELFAGRTEALRDAVAAETLP
jgi:alkylation response protein AidB-like acyl-CoA dehydrogenase